MFQKINKKGTIRFALQAHPTAKEAQLAGSFNEWKPQPMTRQKGGVFVSSVSLRPGVYEYKFIVDGVWEADSDNPRRTPNEFGALNSVAIVE